MTRLDELAKGFLAKATSTPSEKEGIVFVLIHQKTGFMRVKIDHMRNTNFLRTQKKAKELLP